MNSKKKITFLISTLSGGGAEGVCVGIANTFAEKGWLVDLVVLNLKNAMNSYKIIKGKINNRDESMFFEY